MGEPDKKDNSLQVAAKTPVSLLQELYVRKGITPKYDLVQIEGAVHEPTFKYRVSVGDVVATGSGQSKKKAKHEAAKAILTKLKIAQQKGYFDSQVAAASQQSDAAASEAAEENEEAKKAAAEMAAARAAHAAATAAAMKEVELPANLEKDLVSPYDDGLTGNPVGELQEVCMNRRMQPPVYEVSLEEGAPHERNFVINCLVGSKFRESGCGKSKKLAKRKAAAKMLATLKSQPVLVDDNDGSGGGGLGGGGPCGPGNLIDEDELVLGIAQRSAMLKDSSHSSSLSQMAKFYRHLKTKEGTKLGALQEKLEFDSSEENYNLLEEISDEQGFCVTYVDVEERSKSGKFHCFVQLATSPVAVCFGIGINNAEEARHDAAKNALEYLRIMTK